MSSNAASDVTVLKLLARGRPAQWVSDATGRSLRDVQTLGERHGWPDQAKLLQALADLGETDIARIPTAVPRTQPSPSVTTTSGSSSSTTSVTIPGKLEQLLARAAKTETAAVKAARAAVLKACDRLNAAIEKTEVVHREKQAREAEKAAARARVESLERQLREARQALRGGKTSQRRSPSHTNRVDNPKVVRQWAIANGVKCPVRGPIPRQAIDAYNAAHPERTSA